MSDHLDIVMKHAVDSAVSAAMDRIGDRLPGDRNVVRLVVHAAAEIAVQQFSSYIKAELSLIHADHDLRRLNTNLRPPSMVFARDWQE